MSHICSLQREGSRYPYEKVFAWSTLYVLAPRKGWEHDNIVDGKCLNYTGASVCRRYHKTGEDGRLPFFYLSSFHDTTGAEQKKTMTALQTHRIIINA